MRKILTVLLVFMTIGLSGTIPASGQDRRIEENTDLFHGRWIAFNGNLSYEIEFQRKTFPRYINGEFVGNIERIWGTLTYRENDIITRKTPDISLEAYIFDFDIISPRHIHFYFNDMERSVLGGFHFVIEENNLKKAKFDYEKVMSGLSSSNREPDFPKEMMFTKIE